METTGSNAHLTIKCSTCGRESCHGNFVFDFVKRLTYEVCSACRQKL